MCCHLQKVISICNGVFESPRRSCNSVSCLIGIRLRIKICNSRKSCVIVYVHPLQIYFHFQFCLCRQITLYFNWHNFLISAQRFYSCWFVLTQSHYSIFSLYRQPSSSAIIIHRCHFKEFVFCYYRNSQFCRSLIFR